MLFFWTTTDIGKIWLDGDAIKRMIVKKLPDNYICNEVSFLGKKNMLNLHISVPDNITDEQQAESEEKILKAFVNSGIKVQINWLNITPNENPNLTPLWRLPVFWAGLSALLVVLINLGFRGIVFSFIALIGGYALSWLLLTNDGEKYFTRVKKRFWR